MDIDAAIAQLEAASDAYAERCRQATSIIRWMKRIDADPMAPVRQASRNNVTPLTRRCNACGNEFVTSGVGDRNAFRCRRCREEGLDACDFDRSLLGLS